jgi:leucyl/phenylalanyl-tRNA--protein transferase
MSSEDADEPITPDLLLQAYAAGIFPMAESAGDPNIYWVEPRERGIIPLDGLRISSSLAKTVRSDRYAIRIDHDFDAVIGSCADTREDTWINDRIRRLYGLLFDSGAAHTVEAWRDGRLVGGLYGVSIGGAFFGESMFHFERDASKVALVHLVSRLKKGGYLLLDTQFVTPHLLSLGAISLPRRRYRSLLEEAIAAPADFLCWPRDRTVGGAEALSVLKP